VEGVPNFFAMAEWERRTNGFARILDYNPAKGAAYYLAKGGDVEVSDTWFEA
jgi:hypothetical protein